MTNRELLDLEPASEEEGGESIDKQDSLDQLWEILDEETRLIRPHRQNEIDSAEQFAELTDIPSRFIMHARAVSLARIRQGIQLSDQETALLIVVTRALESIDPAKETKARSWALTTFDALIEQFEPLISKLARKHGSKGGPSAIEDLKLAGAAGLHNAISRYKPIFKDGKVHPPITYLHSRINGQMVDTLRDVILPKNSRLAHRRARFVSLDEIADDKDDPRTNGNLARLGLNRSHKAQALGDPVDYFELFENSELVGDILEVLRDRYNPRTVACILLYFELADHMSEAEEDIVSKHFRRVDKITLDGIGKVFGVTESRISKIVTGTLREVTSRRLVALE